jgi:hypothetical protein
MSSSDTDTKTREQETTAPVEVPRKTDDGDHDLFAHYVTKAALEKALFDGVPTRALCGKMWLPTKDPTRYPVCPECKDAYEALPND